MTCMGGFAGSPLADLIGSWLPIAWGVLMASIVLGFSISCLTYSLAGTLRFLRRSMIHVWPVIIPLAAVLILGAITAIALAAGGGSYCTP